MRAKVRQQPIRQLVKPGVQRLFLRRNLDPVRPQLRIGQHLVPRIIQPLAKPRQLRRRNAMLRQKHPPRIIRNQLVGHIAFPSF
jgi:hypothetical protein